MTPLPRPRRDPAGAGEASTIDPGPLDVQAIRRHFAFSRFAGGFGHLLYTAFVVAARRKFAPAWTRADLIRLVADVRAHVCIDPDDIDPAPPSTSPAPRWASGSLVIHPRKPGLAHK